MYTTEMFFDKKTIWKINIISNTIVTIVDNQVWKYLWHKKSYQTEKISLITKNPKIITSHGISWNNSTNQSFTPQKFLYPNVWNCVNVVLIFVILHITHCTRVPNYQFWLNNRSSIIQTSTKTTIQSASSSFNQSLNIKYVFN